MTSIAVVVAVLTVVLGVFRRLFRHDAATRLSSRAAPEQVVGDSLTQLAAFGRALGGALEPSAARQAFWRFMPAFAGNREIWLLTRHAGRWESLVHDRAGDERSAESIEASANFVLAEGCHGKGLMIDGELCLPLVAGETLVGVIGIRSTPHLSSFDLSVINAAASLLGLSIRNSQLHADTRESSVRDGLTGCFTRAYALEAVQAELRRSKRTRRPIAVLMIDIVGFAAFNQRNGHAAGDALLSAFGERLAAMLRGTDIKCRYGGDEFLIILPDTMLQGAEHVASSLADALGQIAIDATKSGESPAVRVGLAISGKSDSDARTLIASAELALSRAKESRQPYCSSSPQLATAV